MDKMLPASRVRKAGTGIEARFGQGQAWARCLLRLSDLCVDYKLKGETQ